MPCKFLASTTEKVTCMLILAPDVQYVFMVNAPLRYCNEYNILFYDIVYDRCILDFKSCRTSIFINSVSKPNENCSFVFW